MGYNFTVQYFVEDSYIMIQPRQPDGSTDSYMFGPPTLALGMVSQLKILTI